MKVIDADHCDYNNPFRTEIGVESEHTECLRINSQSCGVCMIKNDCACARNVSFRSVSNVHTSPLELRTLTVQVLRTARRIASSEHVTVSYTTKIALG